MENNTNRSIADFQDLTPDVVINQVERMLGVRCTNLCRPMTSYINRVFELETESGDGVIAKFYRPGRWSRAALQDEHDFLLELHDLEIPVIAPLRGTDGETLGRHHDISFALFPKKWGRGLDEPNDEEWAQLGRLLARVHNVGALRAPQDRITLAPTASMEQNVENILTSGVIEDRRLREEYASVTREIIETIAPLWEGVEMIRIHGDCHPANIIYRPEESFYLIDFDDMAVGPPVQDFWMLLPDYSRASLLEIELFLEGYTTFRPFDKRTLRLIEPLRAMRYVHFTAWLARQAADGGFARLAPDWGSTTYWRREIHDLMQQMSEIAAGADFYWG